MITFGAGYPFFDHFWLKGQKVLDAHIIRESLMLGTAGPLLLWLSLTWLVRAVEARAKAEETLAHLNQELAAVNAVASTAGASLDLQTVLDDALDRILDVTGVEVGEVFLLDEAQEAVIMAAHRGILVETFREIERFPLGEGFPGRVALTGDPMVTTDLANDLRYLRRQVVEAGFGSYACVPLQAKGRVLGTLSVAAMGHRNLSPRDLKLLTAIGLQLGLAIENAQLFEERRKVSTLEARDRLARDMHDGLVQTLSFLNMKIDATQAHLSRDEVPDARDDLARMRQVVGQAYEDLRNMIVGLKEPHSHGMALEHVLQNQLSGQGSDGDLDVKLVVSPSWQDELSTHEIEEIANIVQEALTNIHKHAQASHAWVRLKRVDRGARIVVEDDGRGFLHDEPEGEEQDKPHFGLTIMQERAEGIGGRFEISERSNGGTRVQVSVPLEMDT
jgi:nitrate/nitrite-specific signal transduction histidine kinase